MNEFEKRVYQYMQKERLLTSKHLLVACSGGVDSMALLHFLHKHQEQLQIIVGCVHVDHMLRGEESYKDLQHVQQYCEMHGIPFFGKSIPVPEILASSGGNVQAVCREQRYAYFQEVMMKEGFDSLATAHHADDNVESIVMSLTKNRSLNGLKGIDPIRRFGKINITRPFLFVTKLEIREYLIAEGVAWRTDPSNAKSDYTRNRFRNEIIPQLMQENPQFVENILSISGQIRTDDEYLMAQAKDRFKNIVTKLADNHYKLDVDALNHEPVALQRRLILILLNYVYGQFHIYPTSQIVSQIMTLCASTAGHGEVHLPNGIIAQRSYAILELKEYTASASCASQKLVYNGWTSFGQFHIYCGSMDMLPEELKDTGVLYYFDSTAAPTQLEVRSAKRGDRMQIVGMEQPKKVARIFIDAKVPAEQRLNYPVIEADSTILAVGVLRHHPIFSKSKRPTDDSVIIFQDDSL